MSTVVIFISGKGGELVDRGDNTYGGKWVVNPSGGLISKGHPLGATGNLGGPFFSCRRDIIMHKAIITMANHNKRKQHIKPIVIEF